MRLSFAPLLWLTFGALALVFNAHFASSRFRGRLSSGQLAELRKTYNQRFITVCIVLAGLCCAFAAARTLISGVETWWLWFLAAAIQFANLPVRRFAGIKLGAVAVRPSVETQRRHRRFLWFAVPAAACLFAAQPIAESAARLDNNFIGAVSIVLMVAALSGFAAAGWAVVWASEPTSTPPHD